MKRTGETVVRVPGSKSDAIRALVVGALARGTTRVARAPGSADVRAVVGALRSLGVRVEGRPGRGELKVHGTAGRLPAGDRHLNLGGSATGLRLLTCVSLLRSGRTILDGDASLRRRLVGPVFTLFPGAGVRIRARGGRPPVTVTGGPVRKVAIPLEVSCDATSQIPSGMLIAGPFFDEGLVMALRGAVVSLPYLLMTVDALRRAGVRVRQSGAKFLVPPGVPKGIRVAVEPDWSSAAYPLIAAAILGRSVRVPGLDPRSNQADRAVLALLRSAGVPCGVDAQGAWCKGTGTVRPFRLSIRDCPDLGPAAAVLALFARGTSRVTGGAHLNLKESNRIETCIEGVRALGGHAEPVALRTWKIDSSLRVFGEERFADGFVVRGGSPRAGTVDPRGDHRIALAFGVAAAAIPGARVLDRACVSKSWPTAWRDLAPLLRSPRRMVSLPRARGRG